MRQTVGWLAEQAAGEFLIRQGCDLLFHRFRCGQMGEIDWVVQDAGVLVFVEVRYRKRLFFGCALASVDFRKQEKLTKVAAYFLKKHRAYQHWPCRFDVLAMHGHFSNILWVKQAFEAQNVG